MDEYVSPVPGSAVPWKPGPGDADPDLTQHEPQVAVAGLCPPAGNVTSLANGTLGNGTSLASVNGTGDCSPVEFFPDFDSPWDNPKVRATFIVLYSTVFIMCFVGK